MGINRSQMNPLTNTRMGHNHSGNVAQRARERAIVRRAAIMAAKTSAKRRPKPRRLGRAPAHPPIPGLDVAPEAVVKTAIMTINGMHCVGLQIGDAICGSCYIGGKWHSDC
jgi:hypothetical protein